MSNIIKFGGGSAAEGNAIPGDVRSGKTFMSANSDNLQTGTWGVRGPWQSSAFSNYGYDRVGPVIDTGNNLTKAVFVTGTHSGSGSDGGGQGSNNNSSWTNIGTGFHTYRYYRAWSRTNDEGSSISYGYVGVLDLGY